MYRQNRKGSITNIVKEKNIHDILESIDIGLQDIQNYDDARQLALRIYFCNLIYFHFAIC